MSHAGDRCPDIVLRFHTYVKINIASNVIVSTLLRENGGYIMLEFLIARDGARKFRFETSVDISLLVRFIQWRLFEKRNHLFPICILLSYVNKVTQKISLTQTHPSTCNTTNEFSQSKRCSIRKIKEELCWQLPRIPTSSVALVIPNCLLYTQDIAIFTQRTLGWPF